MSQVSSILNNQLVCTDLSRGIKTIIVFCWLIWTNVKGWILKLKTVDCCISVWPAERRSRVAKWIIWEDTYSIPSIVWSFKSALYHYWVQNISCASSDLVDIFRVVCHSQGELSLKQRLQHLCSILSLCLLASGDIAIKATSDRLISGILR